MAKKKIPVCPDCGKELRIERETDSDWGGMVCYCTNTDCGAYDWNFPEIYFQIRNREKAREKARDNLDIIQEQFKASLLEEKTKRDNLVEALNDFLKWYDDPFESEVDLDALQKEIDFLKKKLAANK